MESWDLIKAALSSATRFFLTSSYQDLQEHHKHKYIKLLAIRLEKEKNEQIITCIPNNVHASPCT